MLKVTLIIIGIFSLCFLLMRAIHNRHRYQRRPIKGEGIAGTGGLSGSFLWGDRYTD
ncbi:MAG TPA: hypothetical protein VN328_09830 [Thermodesulfovibrionales bacterium]|nr:hypothetical protein [Thermodesulfovibrionales bacterium]